MNLVSTVCSPASTLSIVTSSCNCYSTASLFRLHLTNLNQGDEDEQAYQHDICAEFNPKPFWRTQHKDLNILSIAARAQQPAEVTSEEGLRSDEQVPSSAVEEATSKPASTMASGPFNISGLDRKAMEQARLARLGRRGRDPSPEPRQVKARKSSLPTLELFNPLEGRPDAWQLGEPVDDFIRRLPPVTTSIYQCPWIWAENPHRNPRDKSPSPRVDDFISRGTRLLENSLQIRRDLRQEGFRGHKGVMNKQLNQESKALQQRIADLAKETHVLSGKASFVTLEQGR
jgi:hypothetical protein